MVLLQACLTFHEYFPLLKAPAKQKHAARVAVYGFARLFASYTIRQPDNPQGKLKHFPPSWLLFDESRHQVPVGADFPRKMK
jgi:hypothetical protein